MWIVYEDAHDDLDFKIKLVRLRTEELNLTFECMENAKLMIYTRHT